MKYYVYFDAYGHARQVISERELAEHYQNEVDQLPATNASNAQGLCCKPIQNTRILTRMLGYSHFESACATPLNVIYYF